MRNLDECTAEVFRRSKERILHRKRVRNRIVACCIPLCLVLVVVFTIPKDPSLDMVAPEASPENVQLQDNGIGNDLSAKTLQISMDDQQILYSGDTQQVSEIHRMIRELLTEQMALGGDFSGTCVDGELELGEDNEIKYFGASSIYNITIEENRTVSRYTLTRNSLRDIQTGNSVTLTDSQLAKLLKQLGIPDQKEGAQ